MSESNTGTDSTSSSDVQAARPPAGSVIFGYGNGEFAWSAEDWDKFPAEEYRRVVIDVYIPGQDITNLTGDVLDVEAAYLEAASPHRPNALSQAHQWTTNRRAAGKLPGWYTSASLRAELEPVVGEPGAWFLGDWTGSEHQDAGADVAGTQYGSPTVPAPGEGHWDEWDIDLAVFDPWYEHNHGATPAPGPTPHPPSQGGLVTIQVPELRQGAEGPTVKTVQKLLGAGLVVDGIFGPRTEEQVRLFQAAHGLAVDGVVGPHTWGAVIGEPQ